METRCNRQCKHFGRCDHNPGDDCFEPREQLQLFVETPGSVVTELCVDALTRGDDELRKLAGALLTLIRYHERRVPS